MNDDTKAQSRRKGAEQLPLAFTHDPATGREDLLVADPLTAAVSIVDAWPHWPSPVAILTGPTGSGKSHLAAIWARKSGATSVLPEAGGEASRLAAQGPVLFEDADRVVFDETELFHMINAVRQHGTSLLMTARLWPMGWPVSLADLKSRLKAATVVEIGAPDEELLAQIIVKLFADRQLFIDDRLTAYIVKRMERSLAAATRIVDRLDHLALSRGTRITRALAAEVLDEDHAGPQQSD